MDSSAKDCLKQRIDYNSAVIINCEKENEELRAQLEAEDAPVPISIEGKLRVLDGFFRRVLTAHYSYNRTDIPSPDKCKIHLISKRIGYDETYEWWMILPSENTGGVHFKTIVVTNQSTLFSSERYDKIFVETLKNKGLLSHFALLPP